MLKELEYIREPEEDEELIRVPDFC